MDNYEKRSKRPSVWLVVAVIIGAVLWLWLRPKGRSEIPMNITVVPEKGRAFDAGSPSEERRLQTGGRYRIEFRPERRAYGIVYMIDAAMGPHEVWPDPSGPWPAFPAGEKSSLPENEEWFEAYDRPGKGVFIIAWGHERIRSRPALWRGICRSRELGGKTREERIELIGRIVADAAESVMVLPFRFSK